MAARTGVPPSLVGQLPAAAPVGAVAAVPPSPAVTTPNAREPKFSDNPDHQERSPSFAIDPVAERRLVRKIDLIILPMMTVMMFFSSVDRISINSWKTSQGLLTDLHLSRTKYQVTYMASFISFILFAIPSNVLLVTAVRPSWYLGALMICWGVVYLGSGFAQTPDAMVGMRFVLGAFEAGLQPGVIYISSLYYTRYEYQKRLSILFLGTLFASAFAPLLAFGIGQGLAGRHGYSGWRWVFIVEGAVTAGIGVLASFLVVDEPARCMYLSADEKRLLARRLAAATATGTYEDGAGAGNRGSGSGDGACRMDRLDSRALWLILTDYKIWLGSLVYVGIGTTAQSTSHFMIGILKDFGWKSKDVQVHIVPLYLVAAVFMLSVGVVSDRLRQRYLFILISSIVATIGYCMLLDQTWMGREAKYGASFLICIGGFAALPLAPGWLADNLAGRWKRAVGFAVQSALGAGGSAIVAANVYLPAESPAYATGYGAALGLLWVGALAATLLVYLLWDANRQRDFQAARAAARRRLGQRPLRPDEPPLYEGLVFENAGDNDPAFRYTL